MSSPALCLVGVNPSDDALRMPAYATRAEIILRARQRRSRYLPSVAFADPAWDMLLDLYVMRATGRRISVSSLCQAAGVPASTAQRWLAHLCAGGMIRRDADPADRRRINVSLTRLAIEGIEAWLDDMAPPGDRRRRLTVAIRRTVHTIVTRAPPH